MPVRIDEIAKKLGLEIEQVLVKAKELRMTAARVDSSKLDKITAEYLEQELLKGLPTLESDSQRFKRCVRQIIHQHHPSCSLSNIRRSQNDTRSDYAFELDHLLHRATDTREVLTIVECKNRPITVRDERTWEVVCADQKFQYKPDRAYNVQEQVENHAKALRAFVNPLSQGRLLQFEAIVVSSDEETPTRERNVAPWLNIYLMSEKTLMLAMIRLTPPALRVVQSDLLGLFRLPATLPA